MQKVRYKTEMADRAPLAQRYRQWLIRHAQVENDVCAHLEYQSVVKHSVDAEKTYSGVPRAQSAHTQLTRVQVMLLMCIVLMFLLGAVLLRVQWAAFLLDLITQAYAAFLLFYWWLLLRRRRTEHTSFAPITPELLALLADGPWPSYTILCPLYKEVRIFPQFLAAMCALEYPTDRLQMLFLTEETDQPMRDAILVQSPLPAHMHLVTVPEGALRTKPRACNYGLLYATGHFCVIYDAEDVPEATQLKKAVLTYAQAGSDLGCVQAKLNFYNSRQNLLTRLFTIEYSLWFDLVLPLLSRAGLSIPLGGTSNHFRTSVLRALGGWDAYNVAEDCDLGMRLSSYGFRTTMMDSTTYEEANARLGNWIRQRSRWIKGFMQSYFVHTRNVPETMRKRRGHMLVSLQMCVGAIVLFFMLNPIMWVFLAIYLVLGARADPFYHMLFPGPIFYLGILCLLVGNIFYLLAAITACFTREQYGLVKYCLLLPIYWMLMSVAAGKALVQFMHKPHYWEKTEHGLHLKTPDTGLVLPLPTSAGSNEVEIAFFSIMQLQPDEVEVREAMTVTGRVKALNPLPVPVASGSRKKHTDARVSDPWPWLVALLASIASVWSTIYYFQTNQIVLYGDAIYHLRIGRSVFDSLTPGIAQLGSIWLVLPHIFFWPFVWNDYLWQTGLAGSFASMPCYVASCVLLFLSARKVTQHSLASFLGTCVFLLNPNILYVQATPLSESTCILTYALVAYTFLCWYERQTLGRFLMLTASAFLATLTRYDGWALCIAVFALCLFYLVRDRASWRKIEGYSVLFICSGCVGIFLWFIWNYIIFNDPLYFQRSTYYSAQYQQMELLKAGQLFSYHNWADSFWVYTVTAARTTGWGVFLVAACVFLLYMCFMVIQRSFLPSPAIVLGIPFIFYSVSLYTGQANIWLPDVNPKGFTGYMYAVRYGTQMALPVALLCAVGIAFCLRRGEALCKRHAGQLMRTFRVCALTLFMAFLIAQPIVVQETGIISLQEEQYDASCTGISAVDDYLHMHYNGGLLLESVSEVDVARVGMHFSNVVYEGSYGYWQTYRSHPYPAIEWVVLNPTNVDDILSKYLNIHSVEFLSHYELVVESSNGMLLFHNIHGRTLANNPPLPRYSYPHEKCK